MRDDIAAPRSSQRTAPFLVAALLAALSLGQLPACQSGDESLGQDDPELLDDDDPDRFYDPEPTSNDTADAGADSALITDAEIAPVPSAMKN